MVSARIFLSTVLLLIAVPASSDPAMPRPTHPGFIGVEPRPRHPHYSEGRHGGNCTHSPLGSSTTLSLAAMPGSASSFSITPDASADSPNAGAGAETGFGVAAADTLEFVPIPGQPSPTEPPRDMRSLTYRPIATPPPDQDKVLAEMGYRQTTYYSCATFPLTVECGWYQPLIPTSAASGLMPLMPLNIIAGTIAAWGAVAIAMPVFL